VEAPAGDELAEDSLGTDSLGTDSLGTNGLLQDGHAAEADEEERAEDDLTADEAARDALAPEDQLAEDDLTPDELAADEAAGGSVSDGEVTEDADADGEPTKGGAAIAPGPAASGPLRSPLVLPAALGALAVILGGLAVWFGLQASNATSGVDAANIALTNPAATRQVSQQIASAVDTIFSYNYADTAKTSQAAAALLTGKARGEYNTLFKLVRLDAPKEKLVLATTVTNSGVEYLIGNQARVLIFANQQTTSGSTHKTIDAGAMFAVNAVYQGGRWKIAHIDTFNAGG
jgi:Mce-associated membrane protein